MKKVRPFWAIAVLLLFLSSCSGEPLWYDSVVSRQVTEISEGVAQGARLPEHKTSVETVFTIISSVQGAAVLTDYGFSENAVSAYGEDYFTEYDLVALVYRAYSGDEFRIDGVTLSEGKITLSITWRYSEPRDETEIFMAMIINAKKGNLTGTETVMVYSESEVKK